MSTNVEVAQPETDKTYAHQEMVAHSEQTWQMVAEKFRDAAEEYDLDIYQICAWMCQRDFIPTKKKYLYYFKACLCWAIQVPGLMILLYIQLQHILSDDGIGICSWRSQVSSGQNSNLVQILTVLFAFYISAKMGGILSEVGRRGLYNLDFWNGSNCPPFVSRAWVFFGGYTNVLATLFAIYSSFLVLYISEDVLDVILNSVALFFIMDVDDYMLDKVDYYRLQDWFEKYNEDDWEKSADELKKMERCAYIGVVIMTPIHFVFTGVGIFGALVAPFWIAFCH